MAPTVLITMYKSVGSNFLWQADAYGYETMKLGLTDLWLHRLMKQKCIMALCEQIQ